MHIENGAQIGPYEIVGWLGAGAMGVVYRARDPRLAREVAIKLMPEALAMDGDRLHRFELEARAASQLNHPNVLTVYDVGTHGGAPFIVSELLEGESLRSRLQGGALAPRKAIDYAYQIAEGLAAAHAKNIVHRDLKPDNLFITRDGRVKILDFGIAKLTQPSDDAMRHVGLATETAPGIVLGTPGYMSPEQVRGETIDSRSDLFSCGAILYEMLHGRAAFGRETAAETMAAILHEDPSATLTEVPPALDRLVSRCLEKTREARFQSAHDLAFALAVLAAADPQARGRPSTRPGRLRERVAWAVAVLALLMMAMLWTSRLRSPVPDSPTQFLSGVAPEGASLATEEAPAISPDGRQLAFVGYDPGGGQLLYVRALDAATAARPMTNTDGASLPFWSPTSRSIGCFAQGKLKTLDVATGRVQTLADAAGARGGTWNRDDVILFVPRPADGPYRIPAAGGEPTRVPMEDGPWPRAWFPSFLPDGRHFLMFSVTPAPEDSGIFVASLDSPARTRLVSSRSNALYGLPGYLLFWREGTLVAQRFEAETLELQGDPVAVATAVGLNPLTNQGLFSVSQSGTLVFLGGAVAQSELVWLNRAGSVIGRPGQKATMTTVSLSPDGSSVVYDAADPRTATMDLWRLDAARSVPSKLTFNPSHDMFPLWSPDGAHIVFTSLREGSPQMYELDANAAGKEQLLLKSNIPNSPSGWSYDGRWLLYTATDPKTSGDVWALPLKGGQPRPVVNGAADERYGTLSPDARWLAYISNETGSYEVYVRGFPDNGVLRLVSTKGGFQPQWRRDGRELFYLAPDKTLMAMDVRSTASTFESGPPKALFATRTKWIEIQATARNYAVTPDGRRFLIANATDAAQAASITVVLNWTGALRQ